MVTWNNFLFLDPSTDLMESVILFHDLINLFLIPILILVFLGIFFTWVTSYFNSFFVESSLLEFSWTVIPFALLFFLIFPSVVVLYYLDSCSFCGLNVGVQGHQWYWSYFDGCNVFDSYMVKDGFIRNLDVDNRLIVPSSVPVRFSCSSSDVIHSWTLPSAGFKVDCIPGRINQVCLVFKRSGLFFGQCSEICGINHSFMPIVLEVISIEDFVNNNLI